MSIKLVSSNLSEADDGEIIAIGFFDIDAMRSLKIDAYQRQFLGRTGSGNKTKIERAVEAGVRLPSIVVGMRGQKYTTRGDSMFLENPTYVIDGHQRVTTLMNYADANPEKADKLLIGAEVRFDTNFDSESELFHALNAYRTAVSGNVMLRNKKEHNKAVATLYGLSHSDTSSPIYGKVQWDQRMKRGELITGIMVLNIAIGLHNKGRPHQRGNVDRLADYASGVMDTVGMRQFRENVVTFFLTHDEVFNFSKIEIREKASAIKGNFLVSLAQMFSAHKNFWFGNKLVVSAANRRKLATFPINDPEIMRLSASGTMAQPLLYDMLLKHMNKGKRTHRLVGIPTQNELDDDS